MTIGEVIFLLVGVILGSSIRPVINVITWAIFHRKGIEPLDMNAKERREWLVIKDRES